MEKSSFISYKPLIDRWEAYLQQTGDPNLKDFATYLLNDPKKPDFSESSPNRALVESHGFSSQGPYLAGEAGEIISRLYKFTRQYSKSSLHTHGLASLDEFVILATMLRHEECSKKHIIEENLIELTTGMDMLRRMIKQGLLNERVNQEDKRQKLISISKKGKTTLFGILKDFGELPDVLGDLSRTEREHLIAVLGRLDQYHTALRK